MRKIYTTDLSDAEWACLKNHLPASKLPEKMRPHALREIFDAIFYVLKSGCPWRLLPGDFPPWQTVFYHFRKFRLSGLWFLALKALRAAERKRNGKDPNPSAAIVDSQSVKTTEESAGRHKARMLTQTATTLISTSRAESATCW
jgi:putative transposase